MRTLNGEVFTECKFVLKKEDMHLWQIALLEGRGGSVTYPSDREGTVRLKNEAGHSVLFTWGFIQGNLLREASGRQKIQYYVAVLQPVCEL